MEKPKELTPEQVYRRCDLSRLSITTTDDLEPCEEFIGQERAVKAINFGLGISHPGYNLYLSGPIGVGKTSSIKLILSQIAKDKPTPPDWCYVYNFQDPNVPKAVMLSNGQGKVYKRDMEELVEMLMKEIPRAFESKEYEEEKQSMLSEAQKKKSQYFDELQKVAGESGIQVQFSPTGVITMPLVEGKPITQEGYSALPEETKEDVRKRKEQIDEEVASIFKVVKKLDKETMDRVKELEKRVALFAVIDILDNIREKYSKYPDIIDHLNEMQRHIVEHIDSFRQDGSQPGGPGGALPFGMPQQKPSFTEYKVNVYVDNFLTKGAPVVYEPHPIYSNLFGTVEREMRMGVFTTNFTMIHPGSLAKANGGYLIVEALDVLRAPFVWDSLKKVLENQELGIEDVFQQLGYMSASGLRPEPINVDIKVIMIGSPTTYNLLYTYDEDFRKLFKVKADYDSVVDRTDEMLSQYLAFIKVICENEKLKPFDRGAMEAVIEHSSRLAGDQDKLSVQYAAISKVILEASYWSEVTNGASQYVTRGDVERALEEKIYRSSLIEEKIQEMISKGHIIIDSEGETVGQINGLSVYDMGDYAFGRPSRITSETYMGREGVVNIERRAKLSGNIHDKGVLILSGYMGAKYAKKRPLSLSASLAFEQSYGMIDGDSASAAELIVLISSISGVPIRQDIAITGSVDQKGNIQPIGGANQKVEGFFRVCRAKKLTGKQGVVIPHQNVKNLMLHSDVVEAIEEGKFHIYPVESIDETIEILMGREAGERGEDGEFPEGSVNYLAEQRLKSLAEDYKKFQQKGGKEGEGENDTGKDGNTENNED
ncbi:MAG: AAA family ATPase [Candidatus Dadabacteria bacterium]|nr:AAA family ATPase [Candidatus Dadabacteria bacterium]